MTVDKGCAYCEGKHRCQDAFTGKAIHCGAYDHTQMEVTPLQAQAHNPQKMFPFEHEMTVGDLMEYLRKLDPDLVVTTSVFRPMSGLIYKKQIKFSQLKVGRGCLYINSYLEK